MAALVPVLGMSPVVAALAIGAGSMVGWHVNNSGFWIFTSLYGFDTKQGLKYFTTTDVYKRQREHREAKRTDVFCTELSFGDGK